MSLSRNCYLYHFSVFSNCLIFLLILGHIFLLLCTPGNFLLNSWHFEFDIFGGWIFLHSYKYPWAVFCEVVKLLRNGLIFWVLPLSSVGGIKAAFCLGLMFLHHSGVNLSTPLNVLLFTRSFHFNWWKQTLLLALLDHQGFSPLILGGCFFFSLG